METRAPRKGLLRVEPSRFEQLMQPLLTPPAPGAAASLVKKVLPLSSIENGAPPLADVAVVQ